MLQISGNFQGLRGFGDVQSNIKTLQMAANRYSQNIGKPLLGTDGKMGPLTLSMVQAAFKFLASTGFVLSPNTATAITGTSALSAAAANVADTLNMAMDSLKLAGGGNAVDNGGSGSVWESFTSFFSSSPSSAPSPPAAPPTPAQTVTPPPGFPPSAYTPPPPPPHKVGLSPTAKKVLWIGGGLAVGVSLLALVMSKKVAAAAAP